jgi:tetratricopeptide (TPR) repeat protein
MPNFSNSQIPAPEGWEEFQDICRDLWCRIWNDPNTQQNGRKGQAQKGVDIFGSPNRDGSFEGVQCKCIDIKSSLSEKTLTEEISQALNFKPPLKRLVIATTGLTDSKIQETARLISGENKKQNLFSVDIFSWAEINKLLGDYPELQKKHYPQFFNNESYELAKELLRENQELREQRDAAEKRAMKSAEEGDRGAKSVIEGLKKNKDLKGLLTFLRGENEKAKNDQEKMKNSIIEINRERFAVAFAIGEIAEAQEAVSRILLLSPDDLNALNNQGKIFYLKGNLTQSEEIYFRIKKIATESGDLKSQAAVLGNLGIVSWVRSDLDQAERFINDSMVLYKKLELQDGIANSYGNLGLIYRTRGDLKKAEEAMLEALNIDEKANNKLGQVSILNNLSGIYLKTGFPLKAKETMNNSLKICMELDYSEGISTCFTNLGLIHFELGELEFAEEMIKKGLIIDEKMENYLGLANGNNNLGLIYREKNYVDKAEEVFLKALEFNKKINRLEGVAITTVNLGLIYKQRRDLNNAEKMFLETLDISLKIGSKELEANAYANLGLIFLIGEGKDIVKARNFAKKSLIIYQEMGMVKEVANIRNWFNL